MSAGRVVAGEALACGASLLFNASVALQALEARAEAPEHGLQPSLLGRLLARSRWVLAIALGALGWPMQAASLLLIPLAAAQPALAIGLVLLLVVGTRWLGEPVRRRDVLAVVAVVAGVAGTGAAAGEREGGHAHALALGLLLGVLTLASLAPYARRRREIAGRDVMVSAGLAYGVSGIALKLAMDRISDGNWVLALAWGLLVALGALVALLSQTTALQHRPAANVAGVVLGLEVAIPVLASPLLGHSWIESAATAAGMLVSLAVLLLGVVTLGLAPAVTAVLRRSESPGR